MFYYHTVSYDIPGMFHDEGELTGPFESAEERDEALETELRDTDLETGYVAIVSLFEVKGTTSGSKGVTLEMTRSFIPNFEDYLEHRP